jgi:glycerol uptake facilitator-like aquaporin
MSDVTPPTPVARFSAELIGTLLITLTMVLGRLVAGSALETTVLLAAVWGIALLLLGRWSDQFNPVVTVWKLLTRQINALGAVVALVGQLAGAFLGVLAIKPVLDALQVPGSAVMPQVNYSIANHPSIGWIVVLAEGLSALFILIGYLLAKQNKEADKLPTYVGLGVIPAFLVSGVLSGAVLNFASLLAVMGVYKEKLGYWWGYMVGPLLAVIVVSLIMMALTPRRSK